MDRRTIVFVLLVGITFFGFNLYFGRQRDEKNRVALKQQEARTEVSRLQKVEEIKKRTPQLSDLPVVDLYLDTDKTTLVNRGINVDGNTLTLAWSDNLPESLFVNGQEQWLVTKEFPKEGPVIYAPKNFKTLQIAALPNNGMFEVQLLTFSPTGAVNVYLGEYDDESISVLQGALSENALALYKTNQGYLPLGFYAWRERTLIELQNLPVLASYTTQSKPFVESSKLESEQKYYVLENVYEQLVFSNVGGALVEINLPFKSSKNSASVVKEIGFDREIAEESPQNARFPAHPYYTADSKEEHPPGAVGGFYPLIRRGIWNKKTTEISPQYYALNIVSDYPEMAELVYEVKEFTQDKIVFVAIQPHRKITKTFTLKPETDGAPYSFDLQIQVDGDSRGLWLTSGIPEVEIMSNSSSPMIQYRTSKKGKSDVEKLGLPKVGESVNLSSVHPDWVVDSNGYLGVIMDPLTEIGAGYKATAVNGIKAPTRLSVLNPEHTPYPASKYPGYEVLLPIPSRGGVYDFRIYSGPFEESTLKKVDSMFADPTTGYNPHYIASRTFYGWFSFISEPFSKLLFVVMKFFHTITGSWGFSIILLTVFLKVVLYPLNAWSIKSMRRMQLISPQVQAIQAKYKKEPKKAQVEIMTLYREKKVNPFTGCIPIVIQIPFLIAMFDLLKSSFQLRGASFIPGWIDNLTAPDVLFQWKTPIFFIGTQFHLLPILLGGVMFIQQRLFSTGPKDPSKMTDQQRQQKAMGSIMTLVFAVMFYHFPSGLNLYWLSSMVLGIGQQVLTNKLMNKEKMEMELLAPKSKKKLAPKKAK